jgi:hypothetical protein
MSTGTLYALLWVVVAVVAAVVSARIASSKGHSAVGYGLVGLILPLVGVVLALLLRDRDRAR